jgi:N-methylhydantoinase A
MADPMRWRLAVDIGGTFTDVVLAQGEARWTIKVLTTHADPAAGVMSGIASVLELARCPAQDVRLVLHGTTLATNALIERRGAVTALLTTAGHRDVLEMAFENRFEQYDIGIDRPAPLVPRVLRLSVPERLDALGRTLLPLDEAAVRALVPCLRERGVQSIAIGFLHAWINPAHEQAAARILADALPGVPLTLSSAVCPEIREYERFSTACANAYVKPLMSRYLASLEQRLRGAGMDCPVLLMTSGGGLTDLATAAEYPIRLVESGPAGGAILAARLAAERGDGAVLSFDMGGTTAKICLIDDAEPQLARSFEIGRAYRFKKGSGLPVRIPVIEMVEIGAGGGSIARVDRLERIIVGPDSAGSEPGPACYGRGGAQPTVTDADLVLGRLPPERFAGGSMPLDEAQAAGAIARDVADVLGMTPAYAAFGIGAVVDENMAAAARAHAAERGLDVATRTLVAYGGAGPVHAAGIAEKLKIDRILVPYGAGVGAALGFLLAPISFEVVRSRYQRLSAFDAAAVSAAFADMRGEAERIVFAAAPGAAAREDRRAYMRYVGQGYEIAVPVPSGALGEDAPDVLRAAFEHEYRRHYGRLIPGLDVEVLSWTLALTAEALPRLPPAPAPELRVLDAGERSLAFDPDSGDRVPVARYHRHALSPGDMFPGPALVDEDQTTTVVPAGFTVVVEPGGHLLLERRREVRA